MDTVTVTGVVGLLIVIALLAGWLVCWRDDIKAAFTDEGEDQPKPPD